MLGGLGIYTEFTRSGAITNVGILQAVSMLLAGVVMLGAAEALVRLSQIARNSKQMQEDISRIAERSDSP